MTHEQPAREQPAPPGEGQADEWFRTSGKDVAIGTVIVLVAGGLLILFFKGGLDQLVTARWPYVWLAISFAVVFLLARASTVTASDRWVLCKTGWNTDWVMFDRLTSVKLKHTVNGAHDLHLADADGRTMSASLRDLRGNPALWTLVVGGIGQARRDHPVELDAKATQLLDEGAAFT